LEVTTIIEQDTEQNIGELIAERAERGWDLYLRRRQLITKIGEDTYTVPAGETSRGKRYTVHYGDEAKVESETCTCTDFVMHGLACKHLTAVALMYARRRRVYSRCEVCSTPSSEKALVGIRNDHRRGGPRYCLPHHPENMSLSVGNAVLDRLADAKVREATIQADG
jgi:hypothetical protein